MSPFPTIAGAATDDDDDDDDNNIYTDDADDDDDDDMGDDEVGAQQRELSQRTNQLMDSFREYVSGLGNDGSIPSTRMLMVTNATNSDAPAANGANDSDIGDDVEKNGGGGFEGGGGGVVTLLKGGAVDDAPILVQGELDWYGKGGLRDFSILEEDGLSYDDLDGEAPTGTASAASGGWGRGRNYNHSNRVRYKHALFRSKRFKRGLIMIALATTVIVVAVSVAKVKRQRKLPNWNEELNEMMTKEEAEKKAEMEQYQEYQQQQQQASEQQQSGLTPQQNNDKVAFDIVSEVLVHAINVTKSEEYNPDQDLYLEMAYKYQPIWISRNTTYYAGTTYASAMFACADQQPNAMFPCPYEAYCPGGEKNAPAGGYKGTDADPTQFAPILDHDNAWVQVSPHNGNECVKYDTLYGAAPAWGNVDYLNKDQTQYVMCCLASSFDVPPESTANYETTATSDSSSSGSSSSSTAEEYSTSFAPHASEEIIAAEYGNAERYQPRWYNRNSGWGGRTYVEAVNFCSNMRSGIDTDDGLNYEGMLCPYEAICPTGPRGLPYGGTEEEILPTDGASPSSSASGLLQWAPMSDFENDWVQVSTGENMCMPYSTIYMDHPEWGTTAENEVETRFIMCCRKIVEGTSTTEQTEEEQDIVNVPTLSTPGPSISSDVEQGSGEPTDQTLMTDELAWIYEQVDDSYEMMGFARSQGWEGSNFTEALTFCTMALGEPYEPCDFESLCPNGFILDQSESDETTESDIWVPIDSAENSWYKLLNTGHCVEETTLPAALDVTRYALCCTQPVEVPVVPTSDVAPSPTLPPVSSTDGQVVASEVEYDTVYQGVHELYNPEEHTRSSGWVGQNYTAALEFCASMQSKIPCPYAAICPMGTDGAPIVSAKESSTAVWAPIIDSPNGWVHIGQKNTCVKYNDMNPHPPLWGLSGENEAITQYIVCCDEPMDDGDVEPGTKVASTAAEEIILDTMHPAWYGRKDGYHGTTHEEAELFCKSVGDMHLCPKEACK